MHFFAYKNVSQSAGFFAFKSSDWTLALLEYKLQCVRIPLFSPYIEVRMYTSGPCALVKARTIFPEYAHSHDTQVTRTLYTSLTRLISTVYARTLRAQFTRHVQDLQAYFTRVQFTPPPTRTINAS